jgi:bifunctional non-homologous end joining protein LigD
MAASTSLREPAFIEPMAAQVVEQLPQGDEWLYELKLDGYRALLLKNGEQLSILSRNAKTLTHMYPSVVAATRALNAERACVDGEIVAVDQRGFPSFQALQHRDLYAGHQIVYYAFDLLNLNGRDLTREPLRKRRQRLAKLIEGSGLRLSQELPGSADDVVTAVRAMGLEGVVAKRADSPYEAGTRSASWVKLKLERQQEFVIGGYRPAGAASIDALLVGYFERSRLRFAGKVRAGLIPHLRRQLLTTLAPHRTETCPFADLPNDAPSRWGGGVTSEEMHEMRWTKPAVVVQIRFTEWTAEGRLRHARFLGLRTDKKPRDVHREA